MQRKAIVAMVAGLLVIITVAAWLDISRDGNGTGTAAEPQTTPTATAGPSDAPTPKANQTVVERNRNERRGPSWSPADVVDEDGKPLVFGRVIPGAFEPVPVGADIAVAVDAGFMERDEQREQSCEGTFWKWKGQLSEGLDVIVSEDKKIASLGMSKDGLETAEGISIGNSFGALVRTYGDRLQGPERMEYGQAGAFVKDGDKWIGFGMDNQPGELTDASRIAFIEVTRGERPGLLRDGC